MHGDLVVSGLLVAVAGVLVVVIAQLGMTGRLPRQRWAGIRLPSTTRSDETWRAAHVAGGPWLRWGGVVSVIAGTGALAAGLAGSPAAGYPLVFAGMGALVAGAVGSCFPATRAARAVQGTDPP
jgi:hypothetical protein